jgi:hypothetical protein
MADFSSDDDFGTDLAPEVDRDLLRQMARRELRGYDARLVDVLLSKFDCWEDAYCDILVEEWHARIAAMNRFEWFWYQVKNKISSVRAFIVCRIWDAFPLLDPDHGKDDDIAEMVRWGHRRARRLRSEQSCRKS